MISSKYAMVIQWDDEDRIFIVSLPEWGPNCKTHGNTYQEAVQNAEEVLELLICSHDATKEGPLPEPKVFHYPGADLIDREDSTVKPQEKVVV